MLTKNGKMCCHLNTVEERSQGNGYYIEWVSSDGSNIRTTGVRGVLSSLVLSVGTGSDAPTSSDINITNKDAGLTVVNRSTTTGTTNPEYSQDYIGIFTVTYRNDTNSDVTVSESGLFGTLSGSGNGMALIARDVFDPVTIAPGESYTFSMYIG